MVSEISATCPFAAPAPKNPHSPTSYLLLLFVCRHSDACPGQERNMKLSSVWLVLLPMRGWTRVGLSGQLLWVQAIVSSLGPHDLPHSLTTWSSRSRSSPLAWTGCPRNWVWLPARAREVTQKMLEKEGALTCKLVLQLFSERGNIIKTSLI